MNVYKPTMFNINHAIPHGTNAANCEAQFCRCRDWLGFCNCCSAKSKIMMQGLAHARSLSSLFIYRWYVRFLSKHVQR